MNPIFAISEYLLFLFILREPLQISLEKCRFVAKLYEQKNGKLFVKDYGKSRNMSR